MNLQISSFADAGNPQKERIVFKALADLDIGDYAVLRSGVASDEAVPTSGRKIAYWFPDEDVKADDLVVLYTKAGTRRKAKLSTGRTVHFYYWGKIDTLWGSPEFGAALLKVGGWQFAVPSPTEQ